MQHPTCTNIRIRSVHDAHKIFYAVQQGLLQMVTRRLDADERTQLRTGCVYAWEERGPHTELTGLGIERFTEGRRWSPSRVRDEFLFYYEKYSPSPDCANPHPPRDWDPLVKQTYSVWVETERGRRKWHLTAYFTQATVDQLGSIDDMRGVKELLVPEEMFKSTRVTKGRGKNDENRATEGSKSSSSAAATPSRYAPFSAPALPSQPESSGQIFMFQPYTNHDASPSPQQHQLQQGDDLKPAPTQQFSGISSANPSASSYHAIPAYRPLLPSSQPRLAPDRPRPDYSSPHQQLPVRFVADPQHLPTSLPQVRNEPEEALSRLSTAVPPASTTHSRVNTLQPYAPNIHTFSTPSPQWTSVGSADFASQNPPAFYADNNSGLAASTTAQSSSSYPATHAEIPPNTNTDSYQTMAPYLNPLHGDLSSAGGIPREPLPSLSTLQETYAFSYDFSVAMVGQGDVSAPSGPLDSDLPHKYSASPSNSSQIPRALGPGSNKPGGPSRDLDLAPLNTLARRKPYRREPMDDRALRMLWPRSP